MVATSVGGTKKVISRWWLARACWHSGGKVGKTKNFPASVSLLCRSMTKAQAPAVRGIALARADHESAGGVSFGWRRGCAPSAVVFEPRSGTPAGLVSSDHAPDGAAA